MTTFAARYWGVLRTEAHVHLSRVGDRWTVFGYAVGPEFALGVAYEKPAG